MARRRPYLRHRRCKKKNNRLYRLQYEIFNLLGDSTIKIQDNVINRFLAAEGLSTTDQKMNQVISLVAKNYVSELANEAFKFKKMSFITRDPEEDMVKPPFTLEDLNEIMKNHRDDFRTMIFYL